MICGRARQDMTDRGLQSDQSAKSAGRLVVRIIIGTDRNVYPRGGANVVLDIRLLAAIIERRSCPFRRNLK